MLPPRVAVATSGGRDSTALLHCTLRQARGQGVQVLALHVHHGLVPQADAWCAQVRAQALRWGAGFEVRRLQGEPAPGDSIEAWARGQRYLALSEMAQAAGCELVLLAHHRRDQAETWLLQALRGAGPAGLAAMPASALRADITWARPWLGHSREAVEAYVRRHRLAYVDDSSNADPRFARNRLRLQVWPALQAAFADAETSLAAAAQRAQEALALAREVAALDMPAVAPDGALCVTTWCALPPARRSNVLRSWLARVLPGGVPESLVRRLLDEVPGARSARWPAGAAPTQLLLHRGRLQAVAAPLPRLEPASPQTIDLSRPGIVALPAWGGRFVVTPVQSAGAAPELLRAVTTAARQGGERLRLAPRAAARSLKKQFQALGVPVWQRAGPLLYTADGRLLFVPGLGVCGGLRAEPGSAQLALQWVADPPATGPLPTARRQRPG